MNGKYMISILSLMYFGMRAEAQSNIVSKKIETVVIDAGHGGKDPGAIGKASKEKEVTLAIALKTGEYIKSQNPGVKVIYTRDDDHFVELHERANIANKAKADLFISIHANSNNKKEVNGSEFWVLGLHRADENLEVAKKENAAVNLENNVEGNYGFDPNSPEGNIIMTMKQSLYLDKSILFAKSIEKNYSFESNQINRGTKQAGFIVLYKTAMPSVLVEVGFISNPEEEAFINSEEGQSEIAMKIAGAFADYKLKYETESGIKDLIAKAPTKTSKGTKEVKPYLQTGDSHSDENIKAKDATENPQVPVKPKQIQKKIISLNDEEPAKSVSSTSAASSSVDVPSTPIASKVPLSTELKSTPDVKLDTKSTPTPSTDVSSSSLMTKPNKRIVIIDDESTDLSDLESKPKDVEPVVKQTEVKPVQKEIAAQVPEPVKVYKGDPNVPSFKKDENVKKAILENAKIVEPKEPVAEVKVEKPVVTYAAPPAAKKVVSSSDALVYKVQVKASGKSISSTDPTYNLSLNVTESFEGGLYKYLVGEYSTPEEAKKKQAQLKAAGVVDAFVVKYQNGVRVK